MASLTPLHRSDEVTSDAKKEGFINGAIAFVPCLGGLGLAMRNKTFRQYTNVQSRTALVLMPVLAAFAFTAENKLIHRMEEVAEETQHAIKSVHWAERESMASAEEVKLHEVYRNAVLNSGVRLVDGELTAYHKAANYIQANPFKCIVGIGAPSVALIYLGRTTKDHLTMQLRILHTRVFGQFAVICTLLGVMGLKEAMDRQGKYITESEVEDRVDEMHTTRMKLLHRIDAENVAHALPQREAPIEAGAVAQA